MNNTPSKNKSFKLMPYWVGALLLPFLLMSCGNDDQTARLQVRLTDSPGDYQEVNIDIQGVEVNSEAGNPTGGWKALDVEGGVYNLLELTNGLDTLLGSALLPAGTISQVRLILGNDNSIRVDGVTHVLSTPSAQQSGLKLNIHTTLKAGVTYVITLDFDVARSVVQSGNETYSLKPVIRALSEATSGAISGATTPLAATPAIFVIQGTDTVATSYTDDAGNFLLRGVPAGTYVVSFSPKAGYEPQLKENVIVTIGNVTDLGVITIL
jgi:hypothetical protein